MRLNQEALKSPTFLLAVILIFTLWNSCRIGALKDQVDLAVRQADSIEANSNDATEKLEKLETAMDELKTSVDDNCGTE